MKEAEAVSDDYNLVTDLQRSKHTIIRAALVGAGNIARQHLACLRQLSNIEIVGICDLSRARAQYMAERFEISDAYTSFDRMIEHSRPDIVHVTTPPSSHFLLAKSALHAGVN